MSILTATLTKMLELFLFIIIGYVVRKKGYLPNESEVVLSKLENYILMPSLIINTFITKCTLENLIAKSDLILAEIIVIIFTVILAYIVAGLLAQDRLSNRMYKYGLVVPNFAFMGNALVGSVFGEDMLFNYMIFTIPLNIFAYTIGIMWLMPMENVNIKKSVFNPIFVALIVGVIGGVTKITIPVFVMNTIENASKCMAPIAMIFTGFIIGNYKIKDMLTDINTYVMATLRLLIIPIVTSFFMNILSVGQDVKILILCSLCMPFGLNTIIITAAYGGDTKKGAGLTLVSHLLAVVTIPVMLTVLLD